VRGRGRAFSIHIVDEDYLYSSVSISSSYQFHPLSKAKCAIGIWRLNLWSLEWNVCL
jgi:hypothetical protein